MLSFLILLLCCACAPQDTRAAAPALEARIQAAERDAGEIVATLREASKELRARGIGAGRELGDRLEPLCRRAFFSSESLPGSEALGFVRHTIQKGEIPGRIAKKYKVSPELFAYWNDGYDERRLQVGQKLRVLDLSASEVWIEVDKASYRLALWRECKGEPLLLAFLPVGLGAPDSPTPSGETKVEKRVRDPQWTHPVTGEVFAPGDPGNVLGGYWMALASEGLGKRGIGFHGYTGDAPANWIERPASNGCVRLLQPDIDRLFYTALEGTRVVLR